MTTIPHHTEKLILTALPYGVIRTHDPSGAGTSLLLSVFFSPRLRPDPGVKSPVLGMFPDFLDWPTTVSRMKFGVQFAGGPTLPARLHSKSHEAPSSPLWRSLFRPALPVESHVYDDYTGQFILSYPVNNVLSFIKGQYQKIAAGTSFQDGRQTLPQLSALQELMDPRIALPESTLLRRFRTIADAHRGARSIPPGPPNLEQDMLLARVFHHVDQIDGSHPRSAPVIPTWDFHKVVSALGEYPEVLRLLGLIVDLVVTLPSAASIPSGPASTTVQIKPAWTPLQRPGQVVVGVPITPQTAYTLDTTRFLPRPRTSGMSNGMLNLSDAGTYGLIELDVDSAAHAIVNFSSQLAQRERMRSLDTPTTAGLPALRSSGLSLVQTGRAYQQAQAFGRATDVLNKPAEAGSVVTLYAEDVTRGYRIDVLDVDPKNSAPAVWRSLCQRMGTYSFPNAPLGMRTLTIDDEGFVSPLSSEKKLDTELYMQLPESLFRWTGWSLVAPRPGAGVDESGTGNRTLNLPHAFPFAANFAALPGSLPRLRFGHGYRLRARAVDLAGNGVLLPSTDAAEATADPVVYRRFEPVESPVVLLHDDTSHSPGESVLRMVVRSDFDKNMSLYQTYLRSKGYSGTREDSQRHIALPRTSEQMAETHGKFDKGSSLDVAAYQTIVKLDSAFDPKGVYPTNNLQLPYLPDPICWGATLVGLPGTAPSPGYVLQNFEGAWPGMQPFRLQVRGIAAGATPAPPKYSPPNPDTMSGGVLTVEVPQAEMVTVNLSSAYGSTDDLEMMGIWAWLKEIAPPDDQQKQLAQAGLQPMLTPFIQLTLVHAVQRPLREPDFTPNLAVSRNFADTFVTLADRMPINGKSTNKVDINARWTENWDDASHPEGPGDAINNPAGPGPLHKTAHAFQLPVGSADTAIQFKELHHFGDTKHRTVYYTARATSRFREYLPFTDADISSGKTPITRDGAEVTVNVRSSARPDAPNLLYTVPAFEWSSSGLDVSGDYILRASRRLRVYMNRPWYSSGDGELLGVVCLPGATSTGLSDRVRKGFVRGAARLLSRSLSPMSADLDTLRPHITMWGNDPIWGFSSQQQLLNPPSIASFPLAVKMQKGVTVDGAPDLRVDVAGHQVAYDPDRKLWYCDIAVDSGLTYYPFMRLALARFQPDSLQIGDQDVYLSRIALADFAQLAPDRLANVISDPNDNKRVSVFVSGPMFTQSAVASNFGGDGVYDTSTTMEVTIEEQAPNGTGDLGWMPVGNPYPMTPNGNRGVAHWSTSFELPAPRGQQPFRLVIKEYERFYVSPPKPGDPPGTAQRVVYASTLDI